MPNNFKSVHTLLAGKLLMQEREILQVQKRLLTANHPFEKARRLHEIIIKLPIIPAIVAQAFYLAIEEENAEKIELLTTKIMAIIKHPTTIKNEIQDTLYEAYVQAFLALASNFQQKVDTINTNYKVLTLYQFSTELIIACPTYKNILLVQVTENASPHFPYKVTFILNDREKAIFSFDKVKREKDVWFELSYSAGITYFTTQQIVEYWIPKLYQHTLKR